MTSFLCICLSPALQRTVLFDNFQKEEVNRGKSYRQDASGKAVNTARVLSQLGDSSVRLLCPLGKENLSLFTDLASRDKLSVYPITVPGRTRECWTLLSLSDHGTTEVVCPESADDKSFSPFVSDFLKALQEELELCQGVVFAGSTPCGWPDNFVSLIAEKIAASNKTFLADYQGKMLLDTLSVCTPHVIKINEEEFCNTFGLSLQKGNEKELKNAVIQKSLELKNKIIVTRGVKSTFSADAGIFYESPVEKVSAVNTTACGDSFSAGFIHEYLKSGDFDLSLKKGNWAAARNAESVVPGSIYPLF